MQPNPFLRKLGFSYNDRVAIIHADDIGMCEAGVSALDPLLDAGIVSSFAVMTPCSWFPAAAEYFRRHPQADVGLHGTITCEWTAYRWGPLSARDGRTGLLDSEGFFHRRSEDVQRAAQPKAVAAELDAQLRRALDSGLDLTHIDSHMYSLLHPKYLPVYLQAAASRKLPALFPRLDQRAAAEMGFDEKGSMAAARLTDRLEQDGLPTFDRIFAMPLDTWKERESVARRALEALPAGLSYFIFHPACDTPELRAIAPDWRSRVADAQAFTGKHLASFLRKSDLQVIGWKPVRDALRSKR